MALRVNLRVRDLTNTAENLSCKELYWDSTLFSEELNKTAHNLLVFMTLFNTTMKLQKLPALETAIFIYLTNWSTLL